MEKAVKINYKKVLALIGYAILTVLAIFLAFKLAIFYLPFLIAYIIYKIIKKPVAFLNTKLKIPKPLAVSISIIFFVAIIGGIGYLFFSALINEIISLSQSSKHLLPLAYNSLMNLISRFTFFYNGLELSPDVIASIQTSFATTIETILTRLGNFLNAIVDFLYNTVVSLPQMLVYIIITFLATFFISSDTQFIAESLEKHVPKKWLEKISHIVNDLFTALGGYIKAECIMMSITCFELFIFFCCFSSPRFVNNIGQDCKLRTFFQTQPFPFIGQFFADFD